MDLIDKINKREIENKGKILINKLRKAKGKKDIDKLVKDIQVLVSKCPNHNKINDHDIECTKICRGYKDLCCIICVNWLKNCSIKEECKYNFD